jgi:hypothetical protein
MPNEPLVRALARAFLAGEPDAAAVAARGAHGLARDWRWLGPLARRFTSAFGEPPRPRQRDAAAFLRHDRGFKDACQRHGRRIAIKHWLTDPQPM